MNNALRVSVLFSVLAVGCGILHENTVAESRHEISAVKYTRNSITVSIDPRIELLSVVQYLSDYRGYQDMPLLTRLDFPYKDEVITAFSRYKQHPAVACFSEMSSKGFWYGQPPHAMLYLSNPPELREMLPFDDFVVQRAGGREKLENFVELLHRFAAETDFMGFYEAHRELYKTIIQQYQSKITTWSFVDALEQYYGLRQNSYTIILAPFFHPGGYGPRVQISDGVYDVYSLCGPNDVADGVPVFSASDQWLRMLVWHEFGHSFVNYLTDRNLEQLIPPCTVLQADMKAKIDADPNVDWNTYIHEWVSEHVVRAVTTRLAYLKLGDNAGNAALNSEEKQGYIYVRPLCERLEIYERNRNTYTTFENFYPEMTAVFNELAKDKK